MSELIRREDLENWLRTECASIDTYEDKEYVIGRLREDLPTVNQWHRVEEELPKYGQDVLAARLYGADSDGWAYEVIIAHVCEVRGTNYWNATNVTHWMPLPGPPKEDA